MERSRGGGMRSLVGNGVRGTRAEEGGSGRIRSRESGVAAGYAELVLLAAPATSAASAACIASLVIGGD